MSMVVGVPKETKPAERRVGLTPAGVAELAAHGHQVLVEAGAGKGAGFDDLAYERHGAQIALDASELFSGSTLIVKVKEPQPAEIELLSEEHLLFTYLHLAADPELARRLMASGATCVAYETLRDRDGLLPLLAPMSEIAGRLAVQAGASALESAHGGRGVLLSGATGVSPAGVVVIGAGVAGRNAAAVAVGMGARVQIFDRDLERLRQLEDTWLGPKVETTYSSRVAIEDSLPSADLVIGTVHVRGARTPRLIDRGGLASMRDGSVVVDVSIDQGGFMETSRPTTHQEPTYTEEGVVHYCVTNMPGAVPVTATAALTNATLPRVLRLAGGGLWAASEDPELKSGLNVRAGRITNSAVAVEIEAQPVAPDQPVGVST